MIINVPLDKITSNPWQTRVVEPDPAYIKELAWDIAANGLLIFALCVSAGRQSSNKAPGSMDYLGNHDQS
ncbi:MAG: hypothetical protein A2029_01400 [Chloroflexi bacterium RBG_19FT_COMBO_47_9]|nr:MAG: hypothetical protein A2029_01400 [Chloroflexi bacterium RBG_19FT_COMBO_47_9]